MNRPNLNEALAPLKDFQRRTVDHAFERLFLAEDRSRRFLVADEVGLGKTLVARGVIARAIDHLWETTERIDIIYICSNADIARQNINRLQSTGNNAQSFSLATRMTLLPRQTQNLKHNKLNFISFTPGTSFQMGHSQGTAEERALIFALLDQAWGLRGETPYKLLHGRMKRDNFKGWVELAQNATIDVDLAAAFLGAIAERDLKAIAEGKLTVRQEFDALCAAIGNRKHLPDDLRAWRRNYVEMLRFLLAETCVTALDPDLVILDEFQRFKSLLNGNDAASELANALFNNRQAHTLLLSATPYKMYTLAEETEPDADYSDFLSTVDFLYNGSSQPAELRQLLGAYRNAIFEHDRPTLLQCRDRLQTLLTKVIARTEKLSGTADRNGLLRQIIPTIAPDGAEIQTYVQLDKIAKALDQASPLSYWKSAPYLLNFMSHYKFKQAFEANLDNADVQRALASRSQLLLSTRAINRYEQVDPQNARLRALLTDTVERGAWQLLWLPPALPYYALETPFADLADFSKRIVFSAWHVVPHVVSSLVSYEVERRIWQAREEAPLNTSDERKKRRGLLRFAQQDERLTGMPVLALLYPSMTLTRLGDPLSINQDFPGTPSLADVRAQISIRVRQALDQLAPLHEDQGRADERWYWALPILLDRQAAATEGNGFWDDPTLAARWTGGQRAEADVDEGDDLSVWALHVAEAQLLWQTADTATWGRFPDDMVDVVTDLALSAPANVALRTLTRLFRLPASDVAARLAAGRVAWAFRSLFNAPEAMAILRASDDQLPYWRRVLTYAAAGCFQASMDEYGHVLRESLGLFSQPADIALQEMVDTMASVVALRTPTLGYDDIQLNGDQIELSPHRLRSHFAVRFGDQREDEQRTTRKESVREVGRLHTYVGRRTFSR